MQTNDPISLKVNRMWHATENGVRSGLASERHTCLSDLHLKVTGQGGGGGSEAQIIGLENSNICD